MDEIDIRYYVRLIFGKWKSILVLMLVILAATLSANFLLLPSVYRGVATLKNAHVDGRFPIEIRDLSMLITSESFLESVTSMIGAKLKDIRQSVKVILPSDQGDIIFIQFDSENKELIDKFFASVEQVLRNLYSEEYSNGISSLNERVGLLQKALSNLQDSKYKFLYGLRDLENNNKIGGDYSIDYYFLLNSYSTLEIQEISYASQISSLQKSLRDSNNFHYKINPVVLQEPVGPRRLFNSFVVFITSGLVIMLFVIFEDLWKREENGKKSLENTGRTNKGKGQHSN